ncbi:MAG: four helix bundle suffix domain-containing protein [Nitrospirota bacterium]
MNNHSNQSHQRLRPSGGYRDLRSFRVASVVYDATVSFCERFIDRRSRLIDQMVQAARSGRQNIAEGSRASAASSQTELRLVSVARASLDELLLDYEDFLRQRGLRQWDKDSQDALKVRAVGKNDPSDQTDHWKLYSEWLQSNDPAVVANALICLIHQTNYLLDKQLSALEQQFIHEGGYSERLATERIAERQRQHRSQKPSAPDCPLCKKPMSLRTAKKGKNAGSQFWGCSAYPECKGIRNLDAV